jgi:hypothetical protein
VPGPVFPLAAAGEAYVQVTATGEWDKATRLGGQADADRYLTGFSEPPSALGVELLWPAAPITFVGVRLDNDDVARLTDLVSVLTEPTCDAKAALAAMAPGGLGPVQVAECGAINAWNLVPPITLWDGSTWRDPTAVLAEHPELQVCAYPVGLEVAHRHAWYATEISLPTGDGHVVDASRLAELSWRIWEQIPPES